MKNLIEFFLKMLNIYGIKYDGPSMDSLKLLEQFPRSLFVFNDNYQDHYSCKRGAGNAVLRKFNKYSNLLIPRSVGIPTGNYRTGYQSLKDCKEKIDICFEEMKELLSTGNYDSVVYSINEFNDPLLGTGIFQVNFDVLKYITKQILEFGKDGNLICISSINGIIGPININDELISRYD